MLEGMLRTSPQSWRCTDTGAEGQQCPATSALGTMHPTGRERAVNAGANVVMPNLSPQDTRALYAIYNNKLSTGSEAAESAADIRARMKAIGYEVPTDRGDYAN